MRQCPLRFALLFIALLILSPTLFAQTLEERLKEIDEYAAKAGQDWRVPGFDFKELEFKSAPPPRAARSSQR